MIVNYTAAGWEIITQRAHGLLAAQICAQWNKNNQPWHWVDTLIATAEHDDVYNEFENNELINAQGGPVNFKMTGFEKDYGERLIQMAETKSTWVALLISRHLQFVHGNDPKAKAFIAGLKKREKLWMKTLSVSFEQVSSGYRLLEFCDAFSLLICQDSVQPEQRKMEISNGPDGAVYTLFAKEEHVLVVSPWPFEPDEFRVSYESRILSQLCFKNTQEFRKKVFDTPAVLHELTISRS